VGAPLVSLYYLTYDDEELHVGHARAGARPVCLPEPGHCAGAGLCIDGAHSFVECYDEPDRAAHHGEECLRSNRCSRTRWAANIGTTMTAVLAADRDGSADGAGDSTDAFPVQQHRRWAIFCPVPAQYGASPRTWARFLAALTLKSACVSVAYVLITFFVIPCFFLFAWDHIIRVAEVTAATD